MNKKNGSWDKQCRFNQGFLAVVKHTTLLTLLIATCRCGSCLAALKKVELAQKIRKPINKIHLTYSTFILIKNIVTSNYFLICNFLLTKVINKLRQNDPVLSLEMLNRTALHSSHIKQKPMPFEKLIMQDIDVAVFKFLMRRHYYETITGSVGKCIGTQVLHCPPVIDPLLNLTLLRFCAFEMTFFYDFFKGFWQVANLPKVTKLHNSCFT